MGYIYIYIIICHLPCFFVCDRARTLAVLWNEYIYIYNYNTYIMINVYIIFWSRSFHRTNDLSILGSKQTWRCVIIENTAESICSTLQTSSHDQVLQAGDFISLACTIASRFFSCTSWGRTPRVSEKWPGGKMSKWPGRVTTGGHKWPETQHVKSLWGPMLAIVTLNKNN